jgi:arginyl-tRNA--protein-N-Asp/Glu arginylyltransferase
MNYLHWKEQTLTDLSEASINKAYNEGYVFTRLGKGITHQTRSCRIDLSKFELTSENRRILKKTEGLELAAVTLPLREGYDWKLGKLAKDFYDTKFGPGMMSAQKVKEMLTDEKKSNFNTLLSYAYNISVIAHAICFQNSSLFHYSYPFYDLNAAPKDMGLGMMIRAIQHAKDSRLKYIYLGSLQRPGDTYKLQFEGLEWFDGKEWQTDLDAAKAELK